MTGSRPGGLETSLSLRSVNGMIHAVHKTCDLVGNHTALTTTLG